jgi:hypothetical protein
MAALTAQVVPHAGVTPTLTGSLGGTTGNTAPCGAGLALMLVNGAAATVAVNVHTASSVTVDGLPVATPAGASGPARQFTLPATIGAVSFIPLVAGIYADPVTALATFDVAAGTVSAAVVAISS